MHFNKQWCCLGKRKKKRKKRVGFINENNAGCAFQDFISFEGCGWGWGICIIFHKCFLWILWSKDRLPRQSCYPGNSSLKLIGFLLLEQHILLVLCVKFCRVQNLICLIWRTGYQDTEQGIVRLRGMGGAVGIGIWICNLFIQSSAWYW